MSRTGWAPHIPPATRLPVAARLSVAACADHCRPRVGGLSLYRVATVTQRTARATIRFDATLSTIDTSTVLRLPETASKNLPSRGQVAVRGTINGVEFQTGLEPDGNSGPWMRIEDRVQ